jgi:hypothetical protein
VQPPTSWQNSAGGFEMGDNGATTLAILTFAFLLFSDEWFFKKL